MVRKWIGRMVPALAPRSSPRAALENLLADTAKDRASFDAHEGTLLRNILGLRDLNASDVMIPRADIVSVGMTESFSDIITQMTAANHSRLPVRRETLDDIAGIIHIKDVFAHLHAGKALTSTRCFARRCLSHQASGFWISFTKCGFVAAIWRWWLMNSVVLTG